MRKPPRNDALIAAAATEDEKEIESGKGKALNKIEAQYRIDYKFETTWQQFDTFNMSIGRGSNNYTVIQLANYVATLANGEVQISALSGTEGDIPER